MHTYHFFKLLTIILITNVLLIKSYAQKPKMVVGIIVDQMRQDYLYRFWDKYSEEGFKKLINQGFNCKNTHYNYVPTYTGPGHASVYTGTTPAYHGIAANDWYDRKLKRTVYCVEDTTVNPLAGSDKESKMSPHNLLTTTITDELKLFTNKKAIVVGVSIKNRGAILPAGHLPDAAFWFDKKTGKFTTSSYYLKTLPNWLINFNNKNLPDSFLKQNWTPILPIEQYTESLTDDNNYETLFKGLDKPTFPYNLNELKEKNSPYELLVSTPFGNNLLNEFVYEVLRNYNWGQDQITDFLTVSYSSPDIVGHRFSPTSIELEDTYIRLDKIIADLIKQVELKVGKGQVLFFLTADHAAAYNPKYLADNNIPAGFINEEAILDSLKLFSLKAFGNSEYIEKYINSQVYINRNLVSKRWYPLNYYQKHIAEYLLQIPGVAHAITAAELKENNYINGLNAFSQLGCHYERSGDIFVHYLPGWFEAFGWDKNGSPFSTGTTHGSAYRYDTHVPLIWYGCGITKGETTRRINITDIAPTLSALLNIPQPNACIGEPIVELNTLNKTVENNINNKKIKKNEKKWNNWF